MSPGQGERLAGPGAQQVVTYWLPVRPTDACEEPGEAGSSQARRKIEERVTLVVGCASVLAAGLGVDARRNRGYGRPVRPSVACTLLVSAVLGLSATGCGGSSGDQVVSTDTAIVSATEGSETTDGAQAAAGLGAPKIVRTMSIRTDQGYSSRVEVKVYGVRPAKKIPLLPFSGRNSILACTVDPAIDAVIPVSVQATNTTKGFASSVGVGINTREATRRIYSDLGTEVGGGPSCPLENGAAGPLVNVVWSNLPPGGSGTGDFFLVLPSYYSPAFPTGDVASAEHIPLSLYPGAGPGALSSGPAVVDVALGPAVSGGN